MGISYIHVKNYWEAEKYLEKAYFLNPAEKDINKALEVTKNHIRMEEKAKVRVVE